MLHDYHISFSEYTPQELIFGLFCNLIILLALPKEYKIETNPRPLMH